MRFGAVFLIFFFNFGFPISSYRCNHAKFEEYMMRTEPSFREKNILRNYPNPNRTHLSPKAIRQPIRVAFDYSFLDGADPKRCTSAGQKISWGSETNAVCDADDVMTPEKKQLLIDNFENLRIYLAKLLKVYPADVVTVNGQVNYPMTSGQYKDRDLHITVYGRPYSQGGLASAMSYFDDNIDYRPKVGVVLISPKAFKSVSNYDSDNRKTFDVVLHEIFHAMGISSSHYDRWIDPTTKLPFKMNTAQGKKKTPMYKCSDVLGRKNISFVTTPSIKTFIENRYGNTDFGPNCEAGIELEDDGGTGSILTHPETRAFPGDIMKMASDSNKAIISPLTLSLLEATGYYEVNWEMAELYGFGDPSTNFGIKMKDFTIMSPRKWPEPYQCNYRSQSGNKLTLCYPDLHFKAVCNRQPYKCDSGITNDICNSAPFADPDNTGYIGIDTYRDYALAPDISKRCTEVSDNNYDENYKGATPGNDALCFMSSLNKNKDLANYFILPTCHTTECKSDSNGNFLIVHIGNVTAECRSKGQVVSLPDSIYIKGNITCPDPEWACKMRETLYEVNYTKIFMNEDTPTSQQSVTTTSVITTTKTTSSLPSTATSTTSNSENISVTDEKTTYKDNNDDADSDGENKERKRKTSTAAIVVPIIIVIAICITLVLLFIFNDSFKTKVERIFKSKSKDNQSTVSSLAFDL